MPQHDTYADRMNILSLIYSIPPPPHSPSAVYPPSTSTSTDSTQPSSPGSPSSGSSGHLPHEQSSPTLRDEVETRRFSQETAKYRGELFEGRASPEGMLSTYFPQKTCNVAVLQPNLQNTVIPMPRVYPNQWMMNLRPLYLGRLS
jgi:hypothetical protein